MAPPAMTASYNSSDSATTFSHSLPSLSADAESQGIQEKTLYLSELRAKTGQLQADINAYLTQRMDEEKSAAAGEKQTAQDVKAEEMYGEEDPDQD
jgi:hypothetical protein